MNAQFFESQHTSALSYEAYLETDPDKALAWRRVYDQVHLSDDQRRLIGAFTRTMRVLCISGIWCGDCAQQGPLLQRIAEVNPCIDLRWIDRDANLDFAGLVAINAGLRVPMVLFLAEDYEPVSVMGDRSLTRYRALANRNLGPSCPVPGAPVPDHELAETLQDWLDEFERVHLLLRLSGRLRTLHND
ncbi:MAG: thioredoxin family protein [Phycisphaerales bacterium]|nr:thioredoxin family protein [Phycisphaerales bacterium]